MRGSPRVSHQGITIAWYQDDMCRRAAFLVVTPTR